MATATGTTFEITVSKFELLRELTATQGVVERKTTIPILSNYLFEASADKLSLTATDLDLSLRTSCNAKVKKEGSCTIPARKLYDYVKLLPDAEITIKLLENHWVSIRCGRSNTKMVGMDPERRTLLSVKLEDIAETETIFTTLMGEDVESRRKFIEENALDVKNLDI